METYVDAQGNTIVYNPATGEIISSTPPSTVPSTAPVTTAAPVTTPSNDVRDAGRPVKDIPPTAGQQPYNLLPGQSINPTTGKPVPLNGLNPIVTGPNGGYFYQYADGTISSLQSKAPDPTALQQAELAKITAETNKILAGGASASAGASIQNAQLAAQTAAANLAENKRQFDLSNVNAVTPAERAASEAEKAREFNASQDLTKGNTLLGLGSRPDTLIKYLYAIRGQQVPQGIQNTTQNLPGYGTPTGTTGTPPVGTTPAAPPSGTASPLGPPQGPGMQGLVPTLAQKTPATAQQQASLVPPGYNAQLAAATGQLGNATPAELAARQSLVGAGASQQTLQQNAVITGNIAQGRGGGTLQNPSDPNSFERRVDPVDYDPMNREFQKFAGGGSIRLTEPHALINIRTGQLAAIAGEQPGQTATGFVPETARFSGQAIGYDEARDRSDQQPQYVNPQPAGTPPPTSGLGGLGGSATGSSAPSLGSALTPISSGPSFNDMNPTVSGAPGATTGHALPSLTPVAPTIQDMNPMMGGPSGVASRPGAPDIWNGGAAPSIGGLGVWNGGTQPTPPMGGLGPNPWQTPSLGSQAGGFFNDPRLANVVARGWNSNPNVPLFPQIGVATNGGQSLVASSQRYNSLLPSEQQMYQGALQDEFGAQPNDVLALGRKLAPQTSGLKTPRFSA